MCSLYDVKLYCAYVHFALSINIHVHDTFLKAVNECWGNTETMKFLGEAYFFKLLKEGGKRS